MKASGLARIGADAVIRHTAGGGAVTNLALAFTYGKKGDDGKRPTQWVDASLWGNRAENLLPYLKRGNQVVVYLEDVRIEQYEARNGTGSKLVARVSDIELVAGNKPAEETATRRTESKPRNGSFDDMNDDIPF